MSAHVTGTSYLVLAPSTTRPLIRTRRVWGIYSYHRYETAQMEHESSELAMERLKNEEQENRVGQLIKENS
ncbi:hypothetical protein GCK32_000908 [Trichostrongylus colubriformis]|uniref:Uncharacterized protein n=1 Tax=Trichostrongylus colubriformis TaxID=6319 RepID=A0AAN8F420_TRICO